MKMQEQEDKMEELVLVSLPLSSVLSWSQRVWDRFCCLWRGAGHAIPDPLAVPALARRCDLPHAQFPNHGWWGWASCCESEQKNKCEEATAASWSDPSEEERIGDDDEMRKGRLLWSRSSRPRTNRNANKTTRTRGKQQVICIQKDEEGNKVSWSRLPTWLMASSRITSWLSVRRNTRAKFTDWNSGRRRKGKAAEMNQSRWWEERENRHTKRTEARGGKKRAERKIATLAETQRKTKSLPFLLPFFIPFLHPSIHELTCANPPDRLVPLACVCIFRTGCKMSSREEAGRDARRDSNSKLSLIVTRQSRTKRKKE